MKKIHKGEAGYIAYERFIRLVKSIVLLAVPLSAYAAAWIVTGTNKNVISVLSLVCCIPACMSIVSLIMVYTIRPLPAKNYEEILRHAEGLTMGYELYLTNGDKNALLDAVCVCGNTITALATYKDPDRKAAAEHIENVIRAEGFTVHANVMDSLPKFLERLDSFAKHRDELRAGVKEAKDSRIPGVTGEALYLTYLKNVSL